MYLPNLKFLCVNQNYSIGDDIDDFYMFVAGMFDFGLKVLIFADTQTEIFKHIDYNILGSYVPSNSIMVFFTENVEDLTVYEENNLIVYNYDITPNNVIDLEKLKLTDMNIESLKNKIIKNIKTEL